MAIIEVDNDKIIVVEEIAASFIEDSYGGSRLIVIMKNGKEIAVNARDRDFGKSSIWDIQRRIREALY
jgi:hypothetical protein